MERFFVDSGKGGAVVGHSQYGVPTALGNGWGGVENMLDLHYAHDPVSGAGFGEGDTAGGIVWKR